MGITQGIDAAVEPDTLLPAGRPIAAQRAFDEIAEEGAHHPLRLGCREMEVGEMVHSVRYCSKYWRRYSSKGS
jgi:uncharacterized protein (DUF302 family)